MQILSFLGLLHSFTAKLYTIITLQVQYKWYVCVIMAWLCPPASCREGQLGATFDIAYHVCHVVCSWLQHMLSHASSFSLCVYSDQQLLQYMQQSGKLVGALVHELPRIEPSEEIVRNLRYTHLGAQETHARWGHSVFHEILILVMQGTAV